MIQVNVRPLAAGVRPLDTGVRLQCAGVRPLDTGGVRPQCAGVRPLDTGGVRPQCAGVRPQVHRQVALLHEAAAAVRAGERLLARVAADVPHQRGSPAEALSADGAAVRPLAGVDPHVRPQVPPQGEAPPADAAAERRLLVAPEATPRVLRLFAPQAAGSRGRGGVRQQEAPRRERLAANPAAEWPRGPGPAGSSSRPLGLQRSGRSPVVSAVGGLGRVCGAVGF